MTLPGLRQRGHDVVWVGDSDPTASDEEVLARANAEERILVTLDKDFGELAVVRGRPHCGILRLVGFAASEQLEATLHILDAHGEELKKGALITSNPQRTRRRGPGN